MFGEITITNAKLLGGWALKLESANKLPQDLATAFYDIFGGRAGATYTPVFYVATQLVNGVNHKLIAERKRLISGGKEVIDFAVVTINIPAGDVGAKNAKKVSEEDITDFVLRDDIEKGVKKAFAGLTGTTGTTHKPLLEIGTQQVKGTNYHFICESKRTYPDAIPYLSWVVVNNFQNDWTIDEIKKV